MARRTKSRESVSADIPPRKPSAKARFICKSYGKKWRVYDTEIGSYPVDRPEFGETLPEYSTQAECEAAAAALDERLR